MLIVQCESCQDKSQNRKGTKQTRKLRPPQTHTSDPGTCGAPVRNFQTHRVIPQQGYHITSVFKPIMAASPPHSCQMDVDIWGYLQYSQRILPVT